MSAVDVLRADCSTVTYGMLVYVCCCVCSVPPLQGTKAPLQFGTYGSKEGSRDAPWFGIYVRAVMYVLNLPFTAPRHPSSLVC